MDSAEVDDVVTGRSLGRGIVVTVGQTGTDHEGYALVKRMVGFGMSWRKIANLTLARRVGGFGDDQPRAVSADDLNAAILDARRSAGFR